MIFGSKLTFNFNGRTYCLNSWRFLSNNNGRIPINNEVRLEQEHNQNVAQPQLGLENQHNVAQDFFHQQPDHFGQLQLALPQQGELPDNNLETPFAHEVNSPDGLDTPVVLENDVNVLEDDSLYLEGPSIEEQRENFLEALELSNGEMISNIFAQLTPFNTELIAPGMHQLVSRLQNFYRRNPRSAGELLAHFRAHNNNIIRFHEFRIQGFLFPGGLVRTFANLGLPVILSMIDRLTYDHRGSYALFVFTFYRIFILFRANELINPYLFMSRRYVLNFFFLLREFLNSRIYYNLTSTLVTLPVVGTTIWRCYFGCFCIKIYISRFLVQCFPGLLRYFNGSQWVITTNETLLDVLNRIASYR